MNDTPTDTDLTRLADGTLPDAQAAALRARIQEDPDLRSRLRQQQRAVALVRSTDNIVAPASLRTAIHDQTSRPPSSHGRKLWRPRLLAPLGAAVAAAAVVAIVVVSQGSGPLSVTRTAQLALASPTHRAPAVDPGDTDLLSLNVGSIRFPDYEGQTGWRATGARSDQVDGRRIQTVFYNIAGRQVGYSIVAGAALPIPPGPTHTIQGTRYVLTDTGSAQLVTWRQAGHTCIIAARHTTQHTLLKLAAAANHVT